MREKANQVQSPLALFSTFAKALSSWASRSTSVMISSPSFRLLSCLSSASVLAGSMRLHSSSFTFDRQCIAALAGFFQSSFFSTDLKGGDDPVGFLRQPFEASGVDDPELLVLQQQCVDCRHHRDQLPCFGALGQTAISDEVLRELLGGHTFRIDLSKTRRCDSFPVPDGKGRGPGICIGIFVLR